MVAEHGHIVIRGKGIVTQFALTLANRDEQAALWNLVSNIHGVLIGNKGFFFSSYFS